jgi:hypothetical protein
LERRQGSYAVAGIHRGFPPAARGMKHLADVAGLPALDLGDRNGHGIKPLQANIHGRPFSTDRVDRLRAAVLSRDKPDFRTAYRFTMFHQIAEQIGGIDLPLGDRGAQRDSSTGWHTGLRSFDTAMGRDVLRV